MANNVVYYDVNIRDMIDYIIYIYSLLLQFPTKKDTDKT